MKIKSIIIIDDDEFCRTLVTNLLKKIIENDCVIFEYKSVEEAIKDVKMIKPELIILDHYLDGKDGIDCISSILNKYYTNIMVYSSQTSIEKMDEAFKKGIVGYIVKDSNVRPRIKNVIERIEKKNKFVFMVDRLLSILRRIFTKNTCCS